MVGTSMTVLASFSSSWPATIQIATTVTNAKAARARIVTKSAFRSRRSSSSCPIALSVP